MTRTGVQRLAYHVLETLRNSPPGMCSTQLAAHLQVETASVNKALAWLREVQAPIILQAYGRRRPRVLTDREWCIPFRSLDAQCQIFELERVVAPGAKTDLLECVLALQRENFALRQRLMRKSA